MQKQRYKIVPSSYLILIKDNKILLSRRFNTGFEDGNYGFVSGHGEANETFIQTMVREAKEEANIIILPEDLKIVHVMHRKGKNDERVDVFIRAEKWQGEIKNIEPHKCDDLGWFSLDSLPDNVIAYIEQAIKCVLNSVFYSEFGWK